jgi:hypothetical protein
MQSYAGGAPSCLRTPASSHRHTHGPTIHLPARLALAQSGPLGGEWGIMPSARRSHRDEREESVADEETYDEQRAHNLEAMLLAVAQRILELQSGGSLLANAGELLQHFGTLRSELFTYQVRCTYDTPEIADHRRIVADAVQPTDPATWGRTEWRPDEPEDDPS